MPALPLGRCIYHDRPRPRRMIPQLIQNTSINTTYLYSRKACSMTLAKHQYHVSASIPSRITSEAVIAALHDHNTCLSLQALTTGHEKLPSTDPATLQDTFWYPTDIYPASSYRVTEIIAYLPWFSWAKYNLVFPSCFQNTPNGLKTRADTGGVIIRAEFRVLDGTEVDDTVDGESGELSRRSGEVEWVLTEDVEVVCPWWMMPLVRSKMEEAHSDICRKVVEKVVAECERDTTMEGDATLVRSFADDVQ